MTDLDFEHLGLRVGLEIHQQLNAGHKLFCACPILRSDELPRQVIRKMRPAASELGTLDAAAVFEHLRNKTFAYRYHLESSCLVELDEKPPDPVNPAALDIVFKMARMLDATIVDEIHVMRKTVIDGSAVSGFQRTALIATNGELETSFGAVSIPTISLEEDAATPVQKEKDRIEYRLDRLGIPLIEIGTGPDMRTPAQAKEAAETLGLLLRSFPVVRGIGSIRQDVNVSITGGARVEIKGFQELDRMPELIENEVKRQMALLEMRDELTRRGFREENILKEGQQSLQDVTDIFKQSPGFIGSTIKSGGKVYAIKLIGFDGLLKKMAGDRTFGKELAGYAEAFGFGGIVHTDEDLKKYKLEKEFVQLAKELGKSDRDAVVVLAGHDQKAIDKAMHKIISRAGFSATNVPEETRVADGVGSKYTRPLPGAGRLYPETDIPAIRIDQKAVRALPLPQTLQELETELAKELPPDMARQIVRSRMLPLFQEFRAFGPVLVATTFLSTITDLRRRGFDVDRITTDHFFKLFSLIQKGELSKDALPQMLEQLAGGTNIDVIITNFAVLSDDEVSKIVADIVAQNQGKSEGAVLGIAMQQLRGRADGKAVAGLVRKFYK